MIATIAICLFPLWPSNVREYVWYLSVVAAVAVGAILVLAICTFKLLFLMDMFLKLLLLCIMAIANLFRLGMNT